MLFIMYNIHMKGELWGMSIINILNHYVVQYFNNVYQIYFLREFLI